jgi:hypothetical protein
MTEFEKADVDGNGSIDQSEWDRLALEDRRLKMADDDAQRDAQRKMAWFALFGMLLYPFAIIICNVANLDETKMKIATGELDWDLAAMKATENSWKDEWITLLFSIPLILAFCGDWGNQIVQAGFAALADMPGWYQYSLGGIVSASIGMRGVSKYFGGKK